MPQTLDEYLADNPGNTEADYNYYKFELPKKIQNERTGSLQQEALKERMSLGITGDPSRVGETFFDPRRGVNVRAEEGKFFVEYGGGGIEIRDAVDGQVPDFGTLFPGKKPVTPVGESTPGEGSTGVESIAASIAPADGKTVKRTGVSLFNPATGVDVRAGKGELVVEYDDGTFEIRNLDSLQRAGDTQKVTAAGPTAEELGITRQTEIKGADGKVSRAPQSLAQLLEAAETAEEKDAILQGEGLKSTAELELIGKTYQGRTAGPGNLFYQDPETRKILERPEALKDLAQPSTSPTIAAERNDIPSMFFAVFGREPTPEELKYWQGRTDKRGSAIIGAMQFAKQQGDSVGVEPGAAIADPIEAQKAAANAAQGKLAEAYTKAGISTRSDEVSQRRAEIEALSPPDAQSLKEFTKEQLESTQFQEAVNDLNQAKNAIRELDSTYRAQLIEAERTPGLSMGAIRRNQTELDVAYQRTRAQLVDDLQAYNDIVQSQMAITGMMIDAFKFDSNQAQVEYTNRLNKAMAMHDIAFQERSFAQSVREQADNKARQNLGIVMGLLQEGAINYDSLSLDQRSQISSMEQQVGLPGVINAMSKVQAKPVVSVGSTITAADGTPQTQIISQDPTTGELSISYYSAPFRQRVPGGGGGGGTGSTLDIGSLLSGVLGSESEWEIAGDEGGATLESPPMSGWPNAKLEYPAGSGIIWQADSRGNWI